MLNSILNDPTASNWLKDRVREIGTRDIIDHINDVEVLLKQLQDWHTTQLEAYQTNKRN